jgi:hypothetical protein
LDFWKFPNPDNLEFMEVPKSIIDGETFQGMHLGGHAYIMSERIDQDKKDITFKFMNYLSGDEANYLRGKDHHLISPRKSFYIEDFDQTDAYVPGLDPYIQGFKKNLDTFVQRPVHPYFNILDDFFAQELTSHLLEDQDIDTTISNTVTIWENYFNVYGDIDDGIVPKPNFKPVISSPDNIVYELGSKNNEISWYVTDDNPSRYLIEFDGAYYDSGYWINNSYITISVDGLDMGDHEIVLYVLDLEGLESTDTVIVTVTPKTPTSSTSIISSESSSESSEKSSKKSSDVPLDFNLKTSFFAIIAIFQFRKRSKMKQ